MPESTVRSLALLFLVSVVCACANIRTHETPAASEDRISGIWLFRHKVHIEIPDRAIVHDFDGLMRFDCDTQQIRVAGVAGFGMQLFDLQLTPERVEVLYMHPALAKVPRISEHIAACIRKIWFDKLVQKPLERRPQKKNWTLHTSGPLLSTVWPEYLQYYDIRAKYHVNVRLLSVAKEES